jgi:hypothetical protein
MVVFQTLVVPKRADFSEICCVSESSSNLLPIWPNSSIDGCFFGGRGEFKQLWRAPPDQGFVPCVDPSPSYTGKPLMNLFASCLIPCVVTL